MPEPPAAAAPAAFPITDPDTGEVLALDPDERRDVAELLARRLVEATRRREEATREADECRRRLALVMEVGDAVGLAGGWAVTVKPGAPARREVNRQAVQSHAEGLRPLGLGPEEVTSTRFPGVAQLTSTRARVALARLGLTPETFLLAGDPGEPQVVLMRPDDA
jgi:hypothetical protein